MTITDSVLDTPQEPLGKAFPAGLGLGSDEEGPEDAFAMPVRESNGRPVWIYVLAAVAAIVVLVLLFNLLFGGDDGGGEATPTDSGAPVSGQEAIDTMCGHVQQVQVFRDDALRAAAEELQGDVAALKQAEERQAAKQVKALMAAIDDARQALANQEDTTEPFAALQTAITDLPC
jgi:hypothetical protein